MTETQVNKPCCVVDEREVDFVPWKISLKVPFTRSATSWSFSSEDLPHGFHDQGRLLDPRQHQTSYLETDLHPRGLARIYDHLWLAGLSRPSRSLNRQRLLGRTIYPTERPDEHLLWHDNRMFIKPLPEYLLDHDFWQERLCDDKALHQSACGLLLSYAWLVCSKVDLKIAHELGLLPERLDFNAWTAFMIDFSGHIDMQTLSQVNPRYHYGELRVSRINKLYRLGLAGFSLDNVVRGFMPGSVRYTTFFENNFGWMLVVFVYMSVVLSAMQVALGTDRFQENDGLQAFSFGTAFLAIASVFSAVAGIVLVWWTLLWFHVFSARRQCTRAAGLRSREGTKDA